MARDADSAEFRLTLTVACAKREALESHGTPCGTRPGRPGRMRSIAASECMRMPERRPHPGPVTKISQPGRMFSF